jgi:hypothetical protein
VSDEIEYWDSNSQTLFVGAAGSSGCNDVVLDSWVVFPAQMDEVVAVTAVPSENAMPACGSHYGPEVDIAAYDYYPTAGEYAGDIREVGKTSSASAVISSIAALIWSEYPTWTRQQVRNRLLYATAMKGLASSPYIGNGLANAWGAVGGFWDILIAGPDNPAPEYSTLYTYSARVWGGGPNYSYHWSTGATTQSIQILVDPVTDYSTHIPISLTATDLSDGSSLTYYLDINPRPFVSGCPDCIH